MESNKPGIISKGVYSVLRFFARVRFKNMKIIGDGALCERDTIIVANHAQLNGPIIAQLCMPDNIYIWANGQMFDPKDVPPYAMEDFFLFKKGAMRPVYKLVSYMLAPLMPCVMHNSRAIPVYHDIRMASTVKQSLRRLIEGYNILIFPENHNTRNNIVNQFNEQFVCLAELYYKRTGRSLRFLPMYVAPRLDVCCFGQAITYDNANSIGEECHRICEHLSQQITDMGRALPKHTVIPFSNISAKNYLNNLDVGLCPRKD